MVAITKVSANADELLDPLAAHWQSVPAVTLSLKGTPLGTQPTSYTKVVFKGRPVGAVSSVELRGCHDGTSMFVHLQWADLVENDGQGDGDEFPDAAAVVFPISGDAPINTMGSERQAVNAWYWRAGSPEGRSVVARGIGSTEPTEDRVLAKGVYRGGRWSVVISRSLAGADPGVTSVGLEAGNATRIGVAVWEGSNDERGGFKAFTDQWTEAELATA
jgi:DMSO reductase family type II enzyme heme b subunit